MNDRLIVDVGMHTGRDTEFYLKKGFRVVAIEANPGLVRDARARFRDPIAAGELVIHEIAIADHAGEADFYINDRHDDWGTTSKDFAARNERFGTHNTLVKVRCDTFENVLMSHEIPYYMKIDIEGADVLCLEALRHFEERPRYISIEAGLTCFEETFTELSLLWCLGYREFKIVNQASNSKVTCPNPPLEGRYVDYRFDGTCSGPFGEEAPGRWMTVEETLRRYRRLLREQKFFGAGGRLYGSIVQKAYERLTGEPAGWYDFHARARSR